MATEYQPETADGQYRNRINMAKQTMMRMMDMLDEASIVPVKDWGYAGSMGEVLRLIREAASIVNDLHGYNS